MWEVKIIDLFFFNSEFKNFEIKTLASSSNPTQGSSKIITLELFRSTLTRASFFAAHKINYQLKDLFFHINPALLVLI